MSNTFKVHAAVTREYNLEIKAENAAQAQEAAVNQIGEELGDNDAGIDAASIIDRALVLNARYLYACEVIQYVCNKLA